MSLRFQVRSGRALENETHIASVLPNPEREVRDPDHIIDVTEWDEGSNRRSQQQGSSARLAGDRSSPLSFREKVRSSTLTSRSLVDVR